MKKISWGFLPLSLLVVIAVLAAIRLNNNTAAAPSPVHQTHEVAILFCVTNSNTPAHSILVEVYDATAGAPDIAVGTSCAQALKTLLDADFEFQPCKPADESHSKEFKYTLIKLAPAEPPVTPEATPPGTPGAPITGCYRQCTLDCKMDHSDDLPSRRTCIEGCRSPSACPPATPAPTPRPTSTIAP